MNAEEKSDLQAEQPQRGKWRRRVKNFFAALSAFFCLAAIVAWGFGIAGWRFEGYRMLRGQVGFGVSGLRGGMLFGLYENVASWGWSRRWLFYTEQFSDEHEDWTKKVFFMPSFDHPSKRDDYHVIILPYWLLILLFALAPALWWRGRYVERRQKKFFEQIVAAKRETR